MLSCWSGVGAWRTIRAAQWEMATAALALTLRLAWWTYALSFFSSGSGGIDVAIARIAFSASSHTNRLSWDAFRRSWSSCQRTRTRQSAAANRDL